MAKVTKRSRASNWSNEETVLLAELKRNAREDGGHVWDQISLKLFSRFPDHTRSAHQCRRRWETLVKVYNHVKRYCIETGQDHSELDEDELASMTLDTAYQQNWFEIVHDVCSQRKRKGRRDFGLIHTKPSTLSNNDSVLPEHTPGRETLYSTYPASTSEFVTTSLDDHHEEEWLTTFKTRTHKRPNSEVRKHEEQVRSVHVENGCYNSEQLQPETWKPTLPTPDTSPAEVSAWQEALSYWFDATDEASSKIEQTLRGSESMVPKNLSPECPSSDERSGAAGHTFDCFSPPLWVPLSGKIHYFRKKLSSDFGYSSSGGGFRGRNNFHPPPLPFLGYQRRTTNDAVDLSMHMSNLNLSGADGSPSTSSRRRDWRFAREEAQRQSKKHALKVIHLKVRLCCDSCVRKVTRTLEKMDGVMRPVICDMYNMKVSVMASALPEDVLKQAQKVKKDAMMWPPMK